MADDILTETITDLPPASALTGNEVAPIDQLDGVNLVTRKATTQAIADRSLQSVLAGFVSGAGSVSASDTILTAIQKIVGNIGALVTGVSRVAGKTGAVTLVKEDVGLGNVDNTSDVNKSISTATQTALNAKANLTGAAFTGAVSATNLSGTNTGDQIIASQSRLPKVAILGDSITYQCDDCAGNLLSGTSNRNHESQGYMTWLQFLSGQAFHYPVAGSNYVFTAGNFGVSGQFTAQIAARVPDVIAYAPDICIVLAGANNVRNLGYTFAGMIANLKSIYDTLTAAGIIVVAIPILPISSWGSLTAPQIISGRQLQNAVNNWIRMYPTINGKVIVADPTSSMIDATSATGDPIPGITKDGLHPNPAGAYLIGRALWDTLSTMFPCGKHFTLSQADVYSATENAGGNLLTNGLLIGSGGTNGTGSSGLVADNMSIARVSGSNITTVNSKGATNIDGTPGTFQRLVVSSTGAGVANEAVRLSQTADISNGNVSAGDVVYAGCELRLSNIASSKFVGVRVGMFFQNGGSTQNVYDMDRFADPQYMPTEDLEGITRTMYIPVPAGATSFNFKVEVQLTCDVAGSVTVDVGRPFLRKVV